MKHWEALGEEARFRKLPLYNMHWDVTDSELSSGQVLGGPFGGLCCILRQNQTNVNQLEISMFSQTGDFIRMFFPSTTQDRGGLAKGGAGFLNESVLQLVTTSGMVSRLDLCTGKEVLLRLGRQINLVACSQGSLLCLSADGFLILLSAFSSSTGPLGGENPLTFSLQDKHLVGIKTMSFYEDKARRIVVVVLATQDGKLTRLELPTSSQSYRFGTAAAAATTTMPAPTTMTTPTTMNQILLDGNIGKITPSPSGRHWALANARGELCIVVDDGLHVALQIDTEAGKACSQLCWCGEDAIAACFPDLGLLIVGPKGDWIKYTFGGGSKGNSAPVCLVAELDCVRVLTKHHQELLQRVPDVIDSAFRLGSTSPCAMLVDASELVQSGDARANETLRALEQDGQLANAVLDCIRAALGQFDVDDQQLLLRAAAHGKVFLGGGSAALRRQCTKAFTKACTGLRILNVIRHGNIGIPMTAWQLEKSGGMCRLALRLSRYGHHFLAVKVVQLSTTWTTARERQSTIAEVSHLWAVQQISSSDSGSGSDPKPLVDKIRRKVTGGFASLAHEAFEQGKPELALSLVELERNLTLHVVSLVQFGELHRALAVVTEQTRDAELRAFVQSKLLTKPASPAALSSPLIERYAAEQTRFLQRGLQGSVTDAVRAALLRSKREGDEEEALGIKRDFGLSDIAFWATKVQVYIAKRQWALLERVAKTRPNRLGAVVHMCLLHGETEQAVKFCGMITADDEERADLLGDCGQFGAAIEYIKFTPRFSGDRAMALLSIKSKLVLNTTLAERDKQVFLNSIM
ncbi:hypothetical protein BASA81_004956 [Batrachochytrium salamandrivorans]|nr:hypothetical protein BASA81_004956 [Batrachochytrium salamandrivorans]